MIRWKHVEAVLLNHVHRWVCLLKVDTKETIYAHNTDQCVSGENQNVADQNVPRILFRTLTILDDAQ